MGQVRQSALGGMSHWGSRSRCQSFFPLVPDVYLLLPLLSLTWREKPFWGPPQVPKCLGPAPASQIYKYARHCFLSKQQTLCWIEGLTQLLLFQSEHKEQRSRAYPVHQNPVCLILKGLFLGRIQEEKEMECIRCLRAFLIRQLINWIIILSWTQHSTKEVRTLYVPDNTFEHLAS